MKKLLILLTLTITTVLQAQAPQGFNYQATVRNNSGDLILNTNVYFKFNVIQGSETAVPIFTETHYVPTDDLGQVNLVIGQGTANTGTFSELDWSLGSYYLGIELDTGSGYVAMGTTQLLSVPYALYAANSGNSTPITPTLQSVLAENNSAGQQQIKNLLDPTDGADAVTKSYVDALSNPQGLMNFNGWDNYQVWQDNTTITLTPNSFVFVNANETTLVFPDGPDNCCFGDVIYVYVMSGEPLTQVMFNLQANGFPVAVGGGGGGSSFEFTSTDIISGQFWSAGLKTILNVGDYWMVADFEGQIITVSDIDDDGDGFTENQGDCDDNNATIYPPVIPNQEITICSGDTFVFDPVNNPPTTLVPEGTTYTWTVTDNFNEIVGEESSTNSNQSQISQTLNNYGGVFYGISYEVTPYSPSGCEGQTFELIVYVTLPTEMSSINDMVLMNGESDNFEFYSFPQNEDVIYDWVSDIEFGAGLMGVGNTSFTAINSSTIPIIANLTVTATVTTNGVTCASPPKTFTITVNPDADTVTDQNGNSYNYLSYGNQAWTVENAEMVTYRDGTPIPEVTDNAEWANLTTGAWCYYNNDETKPRLYNWYAVMGIHDPASLSNPSLRKEFAPEGWHVPTDAEWSTLENYLIGSGYNYDDTTTGNKIAKAMASTTGWNSSTAAGAIGNYQSDNNDSAFNAYPLGYRGYWEQGSFVNNGNQALFWSSSSFNDVLGWYFRLSFQFELSDLTMDDSIWKQGGMQVRFVRDGEVNSNAQVNPIDDVYVCSGDDVVVLDFSTTNTQGTTQYSWTNDNNSTGIPLSGIGSNTLSPGGVFNTTSEPQVSTITVTPELTFQGQTTTGPSETFTVTVNPSAQVNQVDDVTLNDGEDIAIDFLTSNVSGVTTYEWTNNNPSIGLGVSGNDIYFTANNPTTTPIIGTIYVTPTFTNGGVSCEGPPMSFTITVNPAAGGTGTVTDQNGNTYDYLTYGDQVWTVDNAEVVTYRDGTSIPQVTANTE